jgi:NAD(P)H dehydrogenase (quinone)
MAENIAVTGATGKLGRLVVAALLKSPSQPHVIAVVRDAAKAADLGPGVEVRVANYDDAAAVRAALAGADKVLLISGNEVGKRVPQHKNVIDAAKAAGVKLIAYTSILKGDQSPMALAKEHIETEKLVRSSGLPFTLLRNGWYNENYTGNIATALQLGAVNGAAGEGRISAASRADYAAAAAAVLTSKDSQAGKIYELAGDKAFTMAEYVAEVAKQSGKPVIYRNLPQAEYASALQAAGFPPPLAAMFAENDTKVAAGALYNGGHDLSRLIGRPTTPIAESVKAALAK